MSYRDRSNDTGRSDRKGYFLLYILKRFGFFFVFCEKHAGEVVLIKLVAILNEWKIIITKNWNLHSLFFYKISLSNTSGLIIWVIEKIFWNWFVLEHLSIHCKHVNRVSRDAFFVEKKTDDSSILFILYDLLFCKIVVKILLFVPVVCLIIIGKLYKENLISIGKKKKMFYNNFFLSITTPPKEQNINCLDWEKNNDILKGEII